MFNVYNEVKVICCELLFRVYSLSQRFFFSLLFQNQQQKSEKRHESRLKKLWRSPKTTSSDESTGGAESPTHLKGQKLQQLQLSPVYNKPTCSLPLLQVWPSQVMGLSHSLLI